MSECLVAVSVGELLDKITILQIKSERIADVTKLANVRHELGLLSETWRQQELRGDEISELFTELRAVNERLWEIEDAIREKESAKAFDEEFIELARSVYIINDQRAALKRRVNELTGSELIEEKSYQAYRQEQS
jgi:hypothetical protein